MKQISIKVPEWMDEDLVKLQMERIVSLETKKRELIEETLEKMNIGEEELVDLERVREDVWKKEKKRLRFRMLIAALVVAGMARIDLFFISFKYAAGKVKEV